MTSLTGCGDENNTADNTTTTNAVIATSIEGTKSDVTNATTNASTATETITNANGEVIATTTTTTTNAEGTVVTPEANTNVVTNNNTNTNNNDTSNVPVVVETPTEAPAPVVVPEPVVEPTPEPAPAPSVKRADASALINTGWTNLTNCQLAEGDNLVIGEWTYLGAIKGFFGYDSKFDVYSKQTIANWAAAKGLGSLKRVSTPYHMSFNGKSCGVGFYYFTADNPGLDTSGTNPGKWQGNGYAETWTYLNPVGHSASDGKPDVNFLMSTY